MPRLILASQSPRRRELLQRLGVDVRVLPSRIRESVRPGELPQRFALRMALSKAASLSGRFPHDIIIAADTVVAHRTRIFGKPRNHRDACRMLTVLCNRRHQVFSAVCVLREKPYFRFLDLDRALVTARPVSAARIRQLAHKHLDKAGAYAVQEHADEVITHIEGSYYTVVGLPVRRLRYALERLGIASRDLPEPNDALKP